MRLEDMTWKEVEQYLKKNRRMILPAGTCEQHGPHLPLNTDTLIALHIAEYLSWETGILIGPALNYGVNLPCDSVYAGTCSTTEELLRGFMRSILEWWKQQGFGRFFILSAHGDPFHIDALKSCDPDSVIVLELFDFEMTSILEKQTGAKHACEAETSVMMHLYPDKVRQSEMKDFETPFEQFSPYLFHENPEPIAGSPGNQGYPSLADPEKGRKLVDLMKHNALNWITGHSLSLPTTTR